MIRGRETHAKKTNRDQDATLKRYVRWHLAEKQRDYAQHGLPLPDEHLAREYCLRPSIDAPDLATVKGFLRFYITTSQPLHTKKPTVDSINTVAEWFFARFTQVTETETDAEKRREVVEL